MCNPAVLIPPALLERGGRFGLLSIPDTKQRRLSLAPIVRNRGSSDKGLGTWDIGDVLVMEPSRRRQKGVSQHIYDGSTHSTYRRIPSRQGLTVYGHRKCMFSPNLCFILYMVIFRIFDVLRRPAWDRGTSAQIGDATRGLGHGTLLSVWDGQYDE